MNKELKAALRKRGRVFRQEKIDALEENIISHMKKMREMEKARHEYFYWASLLWKAIRNHIATARDCILIDRKDEIVIHRGTGPAIGLKETHLYAGEWTVANNDEISQLIPSKVFAMIVAVEYIPKEETHKEWPNTYREEYELQVPIDLELNFTKKAFNEWLANLKVIRDAEQKRHDLAELKRLKNKLKHNVS